MWCFGRIAFPVFAFLVAEGFAHTRNRMRYFLSLLLFAAISEVTWYLLKCADGTHNVMFTLALGVAALAAFERLRGHRALVIAAILLATLSAEVSGLDYGWSGIVVLLIFYLFKSKKILPKRKAVATCFRLSVYVALWHHRSIVGLLRNFTLRRDKGNYTWQSCQVWILCHLSCASDNYKTILSLSSTIFRTFAKFEFAFYV